jgi:ABC-type sugar transport system substrate-binding protein
MMKKLVVLVVLVLFLIPVMLFAGGKTESAKAGKTYSIAYMTPALQIPFWKDISDGIKQEAKKTMDASGVKIDIIDSDSKLSAATQLSNAQDLITRGVDGIIISPTDSASAPSVLEIAEKAGVPVVIADIGTDSGNYTSFIISDNYKGAFEAGKYLAQKMKEHGWAGGDVAEITISLARENGRQRTKGFADAMKEASSPIVNMLESKQYTRSEAFKFTQDILTADPNLRGLFTQHDEANLGAMPAIEEAGRQSDLIHVGFDGSPETTEAIKEGKIAASSMQQPVTMGREAMNAMWDHLQGKSVKKEIVVPTILVTMENVKKLEPELADNVYPAELQTKK